MNIQEIQYALALQYAKGVGSVVAKKLISIYGSAINLYAAYKNNELKEDVHPKFFKNLFNTESLDKAEKEIEIAHAKGLSIIYYKDETYPKHLLNCGDAPVVLFQDGGRNINENKRIISIVGTRNISSYGRGFCKELFSALKPYSPLVVSGYAYGVDICAHLGALDNNLDTLAVMAHGFGTVYPKEHKQYYNLVKESGGFLSEFMFEDPPFRENFLKRNRIVAGMSQATVIIESAAKGGSLVTADIANSYNKDVFAVPGKTTDVYSKGCNNLIKMHKAALITSGEDLIEQLGWVSDGNSKNKVIQQELFVELEGDEKIVYDMLISEPLYMDEISRRSKLPIYKIANIVFQLEMKGLIKVLPGKMVKIT